MRDHMETYTLLLVDDEADVLKAINKKMNWAELGFSVIGFADNGLKALELVEKYQPDVVMTDINMPYMNGLELTQRIKEDYPATKMLIFTGFDEFEYAKEAIRLEVGDYILKPASSLELTEIFSQLKEKLDREISESRNVESLQQYYQDSLPLMQTNFYSTLIEGRIKEEELAKYLKDYQIPLTGPFYCCLVLHTSLSQVPEGMNPLLVVASVQKQAKEYFGKKWSVAYFTYLGDTIMLVQLANENEISSLTDECDRFCKYILRLLRAVVTMGIGQVCGEILDLAQSYTSGRMAVSYRGLYGASRVINIKEIAPQEMEKFNLVDESELAELFKKIHVGPVAAITKAAQQYLDHVYASAKTWQQHTVVVAELIGALYRFAANNNLTVEAFAGNLKELYANLPDLEPDALSQWLTAISIDLHEKLRNARSKTTATLVQKAQEYVRNHYSEASLSLDDVCQALGVSNAYFSSMFKRETEKSFISYLTDYRLDWASRLLLETDEKSYVIGQRVGYTDPNYFSYVFKRRFGISPVKYRTGITNREA